MFELTRAETLPAVRKAVALKYAAINSARTCTATLSRSTLTPPASAVHRGAEDGAAAAVGAAPAGGRKGLHLHDPQQKVARAPAVPPLRRVYKCEGRLRLDDAVAKLRQTSNLEEAMEGWSSARIRAYKALKDKPNTYYYRFNAPGEQQRNGPWTKSEHALFMDRLAQVGADGQWGIFSISIPGRVGYQVCLSIPGATLLQCANYYRKLIEAGEVADENYVIDVRGKAHYVFGTKSRQILAQGLPAARSSEAGKRKKTKQPRSRRRARAREPSDDPDSDYSSAPSSSSSSLSIELGSDESPDDGREGWRGRDYEGEEDGEEDGDRDGDEAFDPKFFAGQVLAENPLPDFIDVITQLRVVRPAISPYGHVLSYDTWLRCLCSGERKNTCPFTNQPLHKRQLVMLTTENIMIYHDIIQGRTDDGIKKDK